MMMCKYSGGRVRPAPSRSPGYSLGRPPADRRALRVPGSSSGSGRRHCDREHHGDAGRRTTRLLRPPQGREIANPGVSQVEMTSDELAAVCPVTGQPDLYLATIEYRPQALCLESKSLKLYLAGFRNEPHFCEALAVRIRDDVAQALELPPDMVKVTLRQKARGGIAITATS